MNHGLKFEWTTKSHRDEIVRNTVLISPEILFVVVNYRNSSSYESPGILACAHTCIILLGINCQHISSTLTVTEITYFLTEVLGLKFSKFK